MTKLRHRSVPSGLLWLALLLTYPLSSDGSGTLQTNKECAQTKPSRPRSYESLFGRQSFVATESPDWRIELTKTAPARECLNQVAFLFMARNKRNGAVSEFKVCNETAQVDEVDVINGERVLVVGRVAASVPVVNLVELPYGKIEDHFECYLPTLSPDHRFLAFLKMFPPHPGPVAISDEYIVYDLTRSAEYNRPHSKLAVNYDAGWAVYPPGATNATTENILPDGSPTHNHTSRTLSWLDNWTLAFADYYNGRNLLAVVNLSRGVKNPEVRTLELNHSQLVDLERCQKSTAPSDYEVWSKEPAGLIHISQVDPVPERPGMVCLHFVPSPCLRYPDWMQKLP